MPWRFAYKEAVPLSGRQVVDSFEVELYARRQCCLRRFERRAVCRDIETNTDCVPLVAAAMGVTPHVLHLAPRSRLVLASANVPLPPVVVRFFVGANDRGVGNTGPGYGPSA